MPEGHTIHRIADRHRELFVGGPVEASSPQGRFADGASRINGRVLVEVEAHGKHLLYHWEGRPTLHIHLGLVGKFRTHRDPVPPPSEATRLALANDDGAAYLTGPMKCVLVDRTRVEKIVGELGPDPLRPRTRVTEFLDLVREDDRPIGTVLLDQGVIAGIGNVYRAEVLFLEGIYPGIPAIDLDEGELRKVWSTARAELRNGLGDGRIITVRPRDVGAARRRDLPRPLQRYVYKREHRPCLRCNTPISATDMAGRTIWWCPTCQPAR